MSVFMVNFDVCVLVIECYDVCCVVVRVVEV